MRPDYKTYKSPYGPKYDLSLSISSICETLMPNRQLPNTKKLPRYRHREREEIVRHSSYQISKY